MGVAVGFSFRLANGSTEIIQGSLEARGVFLGAGRVGNGGGPCGGSRLPKAEAECRNKLRWGEA